MNTTAPLPAATEAELWARWTQEREDPAAAELWRRTQRVAVAVAARALGGLSNPQERARELVDEAFVRALRTFDPARASPHTAQPFRAWFLRLVRSAVIDHRRKEARQPPIADVSLGGMEGSEPGPEHRIDASRLVRRLERWNATEGLEEDWPVLVAWLQCRHDGVRVPWKSLADAHPVRPPPDIGFAAGADSAEQDPALRIAHHKLALCPQLCLAADGSWHTPEPPALGPARARWVVQALWAALRVKRARHGGQSRDRLELGTHQADGRRVRFRILSGGQRSPDALRMRVEKVILGKVLALVKGGAA